MNEQIALPQSMEAEQAILGSVLVDFEIIDDMTLKPDDLYHQRHKIICKELFAMRDAGNVMDFVLFVTHLDNKGILESIGGVMYLSGMIEAAPSITNFKHYENIVLEKSRERKTLKLAEKLKNGILEGQSARTIDDVVSQLQNLDSTQRKRRRKLKDVLVDTYSNLEKRAANKGEITGVRTGYTELDNMTCGMHRGDLIIVAARPSMGKTAYALNIGTNAATPHIGNAVVGVFSLEMADEKLAERQISSQGNIDAQHIRTGSFIQEEWGKLTMALGDLSPLDMYFYDDPSVTIQDIRTETKALRREYPDREIVILIDYLQLIQYSGEKKGSRNEEVSYISRNLKLIAREFGVIMIALSQLTRGVESRQNKRPMMSDIRDSGSIEQDADVIQFLYRDDYYDKDSNKKNVIEIIIAKQRNGPVGAVELAFVKEYGKFLNLAKQEVLPI